MIASLRLLRPLLLGLVGITTAAQAAPVQLADGLFYARGPDADALPPATRAVVDLRFTPPAAGLPAWAQDAQSTLVVLLAGPEAAAWNATLTHRAARILTLSPRDPSASADLALTVDASAVQAAVTAIDEGLDITTLAQPVVDKRRFDESALVRHHNGDLSPSEENPTGENQDPAATATTPPDLMLERAVQVLTGLQALRQG